MKKILYFFLGLVFLFVALLIIVPSFIDWSKYKENLIAFVKDETGIDLDIKGNVKLRILPSPGFAFKEIYVKAPLNCKEKDLLQLQSAEVYLALLPLLSKKIDVTSITLNQPIVSGEISETCNYKNFIKKNQKQNTISDKTTLFPQQKLFSESTMPDLRISKLRIENGVLNLIKENQKHIIQNFNVDMVLESLLGPFEVKGKAEYAKEEIAFRFNIGHLSEKTQTPLHAMMNLGEDSIQFEGNLKGGIDQPLFSGKLKGNLLSVKSPLKQLINTPIEEPLSISAGAELTLDEGQLNKVIFSWGDIKAEGKISYKKNQTKNINIDADLNVSPLKIDSFLNQSKRNNDQKTASFFVKNAFATPQEQMLLPLNISGSLHFQFDAIQYQKQFWRDLPLQLQISQGKIALKDFSLPVTNGKISTNLDLTPTTKGMLLQGNFNLDSTDLNTTLTSFLGENPFPRSKLKFFTKFNGNQEKIRLSESNVVSSFIEAKGDIVYDFGHKDFKGKVDISHLDLDAFSAQIPIRLSYDQTPQMIPIADKEQNALAFLHGPEMDFEILCEQLNFKTQKFDKISSHVQLKDSILTISEAKGLHQKIGFALRGHLKENSNIPELQLELQAKGKWPEIGDIRLSAEGKGPLSALHFSSNFFAFGAQGNVDCTLNAFDPLSNASGTLKLDHPEAGFLFGSKDSWGAFQLSSPLSIQKGVFHLPKLQGAIGKNTFHSNLKFDFTRPKPHLHLDAEMGQIQLGLLEKSPSIILISNQIPEQNGQTSWSRTPLDLRILDKFDADFSIKAKQFLYGQFPIEQCLIKGKIESGTFHCDQIQLNLAQGQINGSMSLNALVSNTLQSQFDASGINIKHILAHMGNDLPFQGILNAKGSFASSGGSLHGLVSNLNGSAQFTVSQGILQNIDLNNLAQKVQNLRKLNDFLDFFASSQSGGQTDFEHIGGHFQVTNGIMNTQDTTVSCKAGKGTIQGQINLPNKLLNLQANFRLNGEKGFPPLGASLTGHWDAPKTHLDLKGIEEHFLRKGVENVAVKIIGKKIMPADDSQSGSNGKENVLNQLLGQVLGNNEAKEQPSEESQPQQEEPLKKKKKGKEILNDLLQGIL